MNRTGLDSNADGILYGVDEDVYYESRSDDDCLSRDILMPSIFELRPFFLPPREGSTTVRDHASTPRMTSVGMDFLHQRTRKQGDPANTGVYVTCFQSEPSLRSRKTPATSTSSFNESGSDTRRDGFDLVQDLSEQLFLDCHRSSGCDSTHRPGLQSAYVLVLLL